MAIDLETPKLTVDAVILDGGKVLLIKRLNEPFKDDWALPGGFVDCGEKVEDAIVREALEETNLNITLEELIGVYSDPDRDPRGHTVSIVYTCGWVGGNLKASDDAVDADWFSLDDLPKLAFDHKAILDDVISML